MTTPLVELDFYLNRTVAVVLGPVGLDILRVAVRLTHGRSDFWKNLAQMTACASQTDLRDAEHIPHRCGLVRLVETRIGNLDAAVVLWHFWSFVHYEFINTSQSHSLSDLSSASLRVYHERFYRELSTEQEAKFEVVLAATHHAYGLWCALDASPDHLLLDYERFRLWGEDPAGIGHEDVSDADVPDYLKQRLVPWYRRRLIADELFIRQRSLAPSIATGLDSMVPEPSPVPGATSGPVHEPATIEVPADLPPQDIPPPTQPAACGSTAPDSVAAVTDNLDQHPVPTTTPTITREPWLSAHRAIAGLLPDDQAWDDADKFLETVQRLASEAATIRQSRTSLVQSLNRLAMVRDEAGAYLDEELRDTAAWQAGEFQLPTAPSVTAIEAVTTAVRAYLAVRTRSDLPRGDLARSRILLPLGDKLLQAVTAAESLRVANSAPTSAAVPATPSSLALAGSADPVSAPVVATTLANVTRPVVTQAPEAETATPATPMPNSSATFAPHSVPDSVASPASGPATLTVIDLADAAALPLPDLATPDSAGVQHVDATACMAPSDAPAVPTHHTPKSPTNAASQVLTPTVPSASSTIQPWKFWVGSHWVAKGGLVAIAPWTYPDWLDRLIAAQQQALASGDFTRAFILARAIECDDAERVIEHSEDIQTLVALAGNGRVPMALDAPRLQRLAARPTRLGIVLAAVRYRSEQVLPPGIGPHLVDGAEIRDAKLRLAITDLVRIMAAGQSPMAIVTERLDGLRSERPADIQSTLAAKSAEWKTLLRELRSSGNQIPRVHCRRAWDTWYEQSKGTFTPFFLESTSVQQLLATRAELGNQASRLRAAAMTLFDRVGVLFNDRKKLDQRVDRILDALAELLELLDRLATAKATVTRPGSDLSLAVDAWRTLKDFTCHHPVEDLIRQVLIRQVWQIGALPPSKAVPSLTMSAGALAAMPPALLAFQPVDVVLDAKNLIDVPSRMVDPRLAAACLLAYTDQPMARVDTPDAQSIVARLIRIDRQEPAAAILLDHLHPPSRQEARALISDGLAALVGRCDALLQQARVLQALTVVGADETIREIEAVRTSYSAGATKQFPAGGPFIHPAVGDAWLAETKRQIEGTIATNLASLRRLGDRLTGKDAIQFRAAIGAERWEEAVLLGHGAHGISRPADSTRRIRNSVWRDQALQMWPDPYTDIDRVATDNGPYQEFATAWLARSSGTHSQRLYTPLAEILRKRLMVGRKVGATPTIKNTPLFMSVLCIDIRRCLESDRANHLPQLRTMVRVVVTALSVPEAGGSFSDAILALPRKEVSNKDHDLVVILAPGISAAARSEGVRSANHEGFRVAVIDDLDFLRIVHASDILPALIEVAFEQFPLEGLSPYSCVDGSHLPPEIFVGRRELAHSMAVVSSDSSRVFSGRRLGKSALLKYVGDRYDGEQMPSQNCLRVIYLSIIGEDREDRVVDRILDGLHRIYTERWQLEGDTPALRFDKLIGSVLKCRPTDNLLIILDEADSFVAAQMSEVRFGMVKQNASLAMHMSRIQDQDANGFPRVRFVVAGYAATARRDGQWLNWSTPVRLSPLAPDEATELIVQPMARLGVDAEAVANLAAFRCGYQPAVIHALCKQLILRISQTDDDRLDSRIRVDDAMLRAACDSTEVVGEIATVTSRNFQDDEAARLVFLAVIDIFHGLPQFTPLVHPEEQIAILLERLSGPDGSAGDLAWLVSGDRSAAMDRISDLLANFVERSLLVVRPSDTELGTQSYALRYPHHLTVLWDPRIHQIIRDGIVAFRSSGQTDGPMPRCVTGNDILDMRMIFDRQAGTSLTCGRIATHWPEFYLDDTSCGLLAALEIDGRLRDRIMRVDPAAFARIRSIEAEREMVVVGGAWLLRERERPHEISFSSKRIAPGAMQRRWRRDRGIAFPDQALFLQLYDLTAGIPILLAEVDRSLVNEETLNINRIREIERLLTAALPGIIARMTVGPDALLPREWDLLKRLLAVPPEDGIRDLIIRLTDPDCWSETATAHHLPAEPIDRTATAPDLDVLLALGLAPDQPGTRSGPPWDRLAPIPANDPVRRLVG